ncbi:MAG: transcriptional regulator [Alphaproteobacteria bacterium PA3]|nr:MAG: transcriptional regulator [Alphaproteobacteria bacterium PA3]
MDRLAAMAAFVRVVETGSFSAAARDLGLGQPAVSKIVAALETSLGVRLLIRTTRGLTPTEAGANYAERARRVLDDVEDADADARGSNKRLSGRLRFAAPVTFARLHIVPFLGKFMAAHPAIILDAILDDRSVDLIGEGVDIALRLGDQSDSSLVARKLGSSRRRVFAAPSYLARKGVPESPSSLLAHDVVIYSTSADAEAWRFKQGGSELSINVPKKLSVSAAEGVRAAVIAGIGLAVGSDWMFAPEIASGEVVSVLNDWHMTDTSLWAVFPTGRVQSAKARAFAEFVSQQVS